MLVRAELDGSDSALGEPIERLVTFDIQRIVRDNLEELTVTTAPALTQHHFTEIMLFNLNRLPQRRTVSKIKEHLASIYRVFLREEVLELFFDGERLSYPEPAILRAPYHRDEGGAGSCGGRTSTSTLALGSARPALRRSARPGARRAPVCPNTRSSPVPGTG